MRENSLTKIGKNELDTLRLMDNYVIVEITETNEEKKTRSGVIVGFNRDVQYGEGEGSHVADLADIKGVVYRVCDRLFLEKNHPTTMPWETEIEVVPGDEVYFDYLDGLNSDDLLVGDRYFKILHYSALYLRARGDDYYPLNGYCLLKPVDKKSRLGKFEYRDSPEIDRTRGIIVKLGRPNDGYENGYSSDDIDVKEGDEVLFAPNYQSIYIERQDYLRTLDEMLLRTQRRYMSMAYKPGNVSLVEI